jgi:hypothetical protein
MTEASGVQITICINQGWYHWSNGQSSWLQVQRSGFDSQCYQISWEVVVLERGPLSLLFTEEKVLKRNNSGSGIESRLYDRRDSSRWLRGNSSPQMLALTSPTSGSRSVGIVLSWTEATEILTPLNFEYVPESNKYCERDELNCWYRKCSCLNDLVHFNFYY